jgi:hypothetical protein
MYLNVHFAQSHVQKKLMLSSDTQAVYLGHNLQPLVEIPLQSDLNWAYYTTAPIKGTPHGGFSV